MTVLEAQRLLKAESEMTGIEVALATLIRATTFRIDGVTEEMSEVGGEARRQDIVIRSLRRRVEAIEGIDKGGR